MSDKLDTWDINMIITIIERDGYVTKECRERLINKVKELTE